MWIDTKTPVPSVHSTICALGDNMFEDVNKDGKLTEEDLVYLGTDDPKVHFSIKQVWREWF